MLNAIKNLGVKGNLILGGVVLCAGLVILPIVKPWVTVPAGHKGVEMHFGAVQNNVLSEGIHLRLPIRDSFEMIEIREQKVEAICTAVSKDVQKAHSKIAVVYKIDPATVNKLYKEVGLSYNDKIVSPAIQECVKASTAKYSAEDLVLKREIVSQEMKNLLQSKLNAYKMVITMFNVTDFDFSDGFNEAIEAKQTAQQNALTANNDLERIKAEAKQKVEQARAEAESLRLQKEQITPTLLELRKIEAQQEWIKAWEKGGSKVPQYMMGDNGVMPMMQVK